MPVKFPIKRGDTLPLVKAQLLDNLGPVDLTGCAVRFLMSPSVDEAPKVARAADVTVPLEGRIVFRWQDGDTDEAGNFLGEFEVTFPDGHRETFPNEDDYIYIKVAGDLG